MVNFLQVNQLHHHRNLCRLLQPLTQCKRSLLQLVAGPGRMPLRILFSTGACLKYLPLLSIVDGLFVFLKDKSAMRFAAHAPLTGVHKSNPS